MRKVFAAYGSVTDCKLKYTKDGIFRKFAFVGFMTEEDAAIAMNRLNNTFLDSSRIVVEICKPFGDESKPRSWSKYSKDSSSYKRIIAPTADKKTLTQAKNVVPKSANKDAKLDEFFKLHGENLETNTEANKSDTICVPENVLEMQLLQQKPAVEKNALLISGLPPSVKLKNLKEFVAPVRIKTVRVARSDKICLALVSFQRSADMRRLLKRNGEFFGGYRLEVKKLPEHTIPAENTESEIRNANGQQDQRELQLISDTGRLFVRNLSFLCTEEDLTNLFKVFGPLAEVSLPVDKGCQKVKGYAVVTFVIPEHAVKAYSQLDGTVFMGRMLHVIAGKEKPETASPAQDSSLSEFKKKKQAHIKAMASKSGTWNALFLGPSAAADAVAKKLDTQKKELLDPASDASLGVRLALGETRLVKETRDFLLSHGVKLDSFSRPDGERSKSVILVKNLPASTEPDRVRIAFEKFGTVGRVVLPPTGVTALVEFLEASEAKQGFEGLAYSRFGSVPLFLEWAPGDVFSGAVVEAEQNDEESSGDKGNTQMGVNEFEERKEGDDGEIQPERGTEIFVKNLNFETCDDDLRRKFERIGKLYYGTVAKKSDPRHPGTLLSMGFGFVQYLKEADAERALKDLQGTMLDGHALELKLSTRDTSEQDVERKPTRYLEQGSSTKIIVRNVPFQANKKEISELFSAFGDIRSVRLPKKLSGLEAKAGGGASSKNCAHRGFAFVDFTTRATARRAFKALCHSTHLYGRRLVLEWAKEDETLEDVRKRTADHFNVGAGDRVKKAKERKQFLQSLTASVGV